MEDDPSRFPGRIVQHQILGAVQIQPDAGLEGQFLHPVGGESRAIEDHVAGIGFLFRFHQEAVFGSGNGMYLCIHGGFCAVLQGVFIGRNAQLPGIHRARGGGQQRRLYTGTEHGLHILGLRAGQEPDPRDTVLDAVLKLSFHLGNRGLIIGHQQGAAPGERDFQFPAQFFHPGIAPDGQGRFQASGLVVVTGVDHGGIGPGDAGADVPLLFQQTDGNVPSAQIPGRKTAQNTAADDDRIKMFHIRQWE